MVVKASNVVEAKGHFQGCKCNVCVVPGSVTKMQNALDTKVGEPTIKCGGCRHWANGTTCLKGFYKMAVWNNKEGLDEKGYPDCYTRDIMTSYCTGCRDDNEGGNRCKLGFVKRIVELNTTHQDCWRAMVAGNKGVAGTGKVVAIQNRKPIGVVTASQRDLQETIRKATAEKKTLGSCVWVACRLWKPNEACSMNVLEQGLSGYPSCANFIYGGIRNGRRTTTAVTTPTTPVVKEDEDVRAIEGAPIKMPDGETVWLREDMVVWGKPEAFGSKAFVQSKGVDLLVSLRGNTRKLKIEPELLREPTEEWKLPIEVLTKWAAMMLDTTDTEMSCLYGKKLKAKKGELVWLGVVPKQECTAASVDVDDQGKAVALLAKRGYKMVGSIHLHPGGMTSCSGTDKNEHWAISGGIHIIVTRVGTTGAYFAAGGTTWKLHGKIWQYGALWSDKNSYTSKNLKEWRAEGTLITEEGLKKIKTMVSRPFIKTTYYGQQTQNTQGRYQRVEANRQISARGRTNTGTASHSCYVCTRYVGKKKKCTDLLWPTTWGFDGQVQGCGFFVQRITKKDKNCHTCTYYDDGVKKVIPCVLNILADDKRGCKEWEAPREAKKKVGNLREALMVMVDESKDYTKEQQEWLEDRIDEWNGIASFFHDMFQELQTLTPMDKNLTNLGPQVEEVARRLGILAIVMAGQELDTEEEYMIEQGLVGDPDEETKEPLFV